MSIGETNGPIHVVLRWDVILLIYSLGQTSNSLLQPFENLVKLLMIHFGSGQKNRNWPSKGRSSKLMSH